MPMVTDTASAISQGCGRRDQWGGATEPGRSSQPWATLREELRKETVPLFQSPDLYCTMKYYETIGRKLWRTFLRQNEMVLFY